MTTKRQLRAEVGRLSDELEESRAARARLVDERNEARARFDRSESSYRKLTELAMAQAGERHIEFMDALTRIETRLPKPRARKSVKKVAAVKSAKKRARKPTKR